MLCLSSFLRQPRHTRACHLVLEFFMQMHLHDHNSVTPCPGRLDAAQHLNFPVTPLRQNRGETSIFLGTVNASAVLFKGLGYQILAIGQLEMRGE